MPEQEPISLDERLIGNIREELEAQTVGRGLGLDDAILEQLAWAIAVNLRYAFDVTWAPKWAREVHSWMEADEDMPTGENHFVECLRCGWLTGQNPSKAQAQAEYLGHVASHHPSSEGCSSG
ncbi:hypothetical protein Pth03_12590 [Planotetraspora thailandica]|uniref:Uncharacterized protein n=1 Tax=Planotetraspora thailandica TaxID=487172 RepID=A0A8J3UYA2_9ACTN|nr:hypothetical protein [Planotetraspora thailandica]GII52870.1 hypothetical protein Pth03_12590 [Planotetraspora thailandica]